MAKKPKYERIIFDTEIIGTKKPVFLIGCKNIDTKKTHAFWLHKKGHLEAFRKMILDPKYTWIGFNSENFDRPLIAAALMGYKADSLKIIANTIIGRQLKSWITYREFNLNFVDYDHIDLFDVAPGPMISLKTYAGRMSYPTMVDMPIHHDHDCNAKEQKIIEDYCINDLGVTEALYNTLSTELDLRVEMSIQYDIDLRSKSDAQIAEAILKKTVGIAGGDKIIPSFVNYRAPDFIKTKNKHIQSLITAIEDHSFKINHGNGSPVPAPFMEDEFILNKGTYKVGIGGLHSTHDVKLYVEETEDLMISDFDVASYYPNIMMKAGLIPRIKGNKGAKFLEEYRKIYEARMKAKKEGNKKVANSLKILLNGTFGKLGSLFCSFYSPDLMLGVTLTGQLNLLCLIAEIEKIPGCVVKSANTDGIMVAYPPKARDKLLAAIKANEKLTGFEYEETPYRKVGMANVNNYIAIKKDNSYKAKGLFAKAGVQEMKNPTMEVCSKMAADYLINGTRPEESIKKYTDIRDFVAIRNVQGGGIQYDKYVLVDDWVQVEEGIWRRPCWDTLKAPVRRKSRPAPVEVGQGGTPFGRVARWYMTTAKIPPLCYVGSGNKVPKTEGGRACLTLPKTLPKDLDFSWYIQETYEILGNIGVDYS